MGSDLAAPAPLAFALPDAAAAARLGAGIGARLQLGEAVCLWGPLGAGKTTLARGLIRSLTTPQEEVPSPTFTLAQIYETARLTVTHFDLYRLASPEEALEVGVDEALDTGAALIEWPERLEGGLPPDRLDVVMSFSPHRGSGGAAEGRLVRLVGHGSWSSRANQLETPTGP